MAHSPESSTDTTPAISISDLSFSYGSQPALRGITLEIPEDALIAVLGPNGSGKTTLFRLLATALPCRKGAIHVLGNDLSARLNTARARMGVVFQSPALDRMLTVRENLTHHGKLRGLSGAGLRARIADGAGRMGLNDHLNRRVDQLSGGWTRRADLARALLHEPPILILDEPTTGLDPAARDDFWQLLEVQRRAEHLTILFTTHHFEEADRADRVIILDDGAVVADGVPLELRAQLGQQIATISCRNVDAVLARVQGKGRAARIDNRLVRVVLNGSDDSAGDLLNELGAQVESIQIAHPTLADVFYDRTGRRFSEENSQSPGAASGPSSR